MLSKKCAVQNQEITLNISYLTYISLLVCGALFLRWGGCCLQTTRNTENQQSSEKLNHSESWTRALRLLKSVLRAHHLNSAEYSKVNLPFLSMFACFCLFLISFMVIIFQLHIFFLCPRVLGTETGSKDDACFCCSSLARQSFKTLKKLPLPLIKIRAPAKQAGVSFQCHVCFQSQLSSIHVHSWIELILGYPGWRSLLFGIC